MMKNAKAGFTLAEVLTTLMVIGVVAALTIPALLNSTNEAQSKAQAKKAASVIGQATQLLSANEESCSFDGSAASGPSSELAACFMTVMSGTRNNNAITTADGMVYYFYAPKQASGDHLLSTVCGDTTSTTAPCGVIVDTNGLTKNTKATPTATYKGSESTAFSALTDGVDIAAFKLASSGAVIDPLSKKAMGYLYGSTTQATGSSDLKTCYSCSGETATDGTKSCKCETKTIAKNKTCKESGYYDSDQTKSGSDCPTLTK